MNPDGDSWPEKVLAKALELRARTGMAKLSHAEIGALIGKTANAVTGKFQRLGYHRPSPIKRTKTLGTAPPEKKPKDTLPPLASVDTPVRRPHRLTVEVPVPVVDVVDSLADYPDLIWWPDAPRPEVKHRSTSLCAYLAGDKAPYVECDDPCVPGRSWCEKHVQRVFDRRGGARRHEVALLYR